MKESIALILVESSFRQAHWWQVYEQSLAEEISRRSLDFSFVYDSAIPDAQSNEPRLAILFGTTAGWLYETLALCRRALLKPVIVSPEPNEPVAGASLVLPDRVGSTHKLVAYLASHGKRNLAMFNPRPTSANGTARRGLPAGVPGRSVRRVCRRRAGTAHKRRDSCPPGVVA
jgi:hypothetical protein